jgi:hypothetical protein
MVLPSQGTNTTDLSKHIRRLFGPVANRNRWDDRQPGQVKESNIEQDDDGVCSGRCGVMYSNFECL